MSQGCSVLEDLERGRCLVKTLRSRRVRECAVRCRARVDQDIQDRIRVGLIVRNIVICKP